MGHSKKPMILGPFQKCWISKLLMGFERQVVQALLEAQADLDAQWLATRRIKMGIHAVMLMIAEGQTC